MLSQRSESIVLTWNLAPVKAIKLRRGPLEDRKLRINGFIIYELSITLRMKKRMRDEEYMNEE